MPSIVVTVILSALALGATVALMPGISAENGWAVLGAAIILGLLGALLRPLLVRLLSRVGWAGVVAGWLVAQALLVWAALWLAPGVHVDGFWGAFAASWLGAVLMSIGLWAVTAGQSGPATQHLLRVNRRFRKKVPRTETPGVVMIQIDGLSAPLARWAIEAGNLPTLGRWLRSGSHALTEWHAQLPATTPASQAGLLHGASDQIPAFRWYEKSSARLVVTNRPKDSALVESRCSDGRGLLADGGVSVSNVFSGDAATSLLTMSTAGSAGPSRYLTAYLIDPYGLTRSLILTVGEIVKELYQARRQRLRDVRPRMRRRGSYVFLRGATNVLLRHLNLAIITEQMMRGAPSIYCDFVDYDEIAHHAGPARPESLASLEGIDGVLATLEEVAAAAPRPYVFVVLSDHGQSQGATFEQRFGLRLEQVIGQLTTDAEVVATREDEQEGRAHALRAGLSGTDKAPPPQPATVPDTPEIVVASSGNLSLVYLARLPGRVTLEQIDDRHPKLLDGLIEHPGVGWVMVRSAEHGAVVLGRNGRRRLRDGHVDGLDPLLGFGPRAAEDLIRHDGLANTGDLVINSCWDPESQEVAAFEDLIGCHGGLGGDQNRPVLIHPRSWRVPVELVGADAVHRLLCRALSETGCRPPSSVRGEPGEAAGARR
ncbi:putative phosphodiesterase/nucleotide pyrophosphatase [Actinoplanes missouriensis 431]|uniref:Putative phosphodiesterase/nucleotide pyrophosphatase n=1 Tax=Actinoplanes missouriensis (strain ATCC 14538 / DSM 43046 / CBS 188.64 / JCM 3121 / NBRC 102363 / NCIMB 12654 / NRRL B-3342 / UNCC 431) TaxID=512565 RepID=I0H1X5_ACTM4|nr:phage holin family protein [Actinoplanes missouriensis]BAL87012.1 putative phosphodiesterase/nucleotide pyrophosphatase [Actinoplanes missouriensis 431]